MDRDFTLTDVTFNVKLTFFIIYSTLVPMFDYYGYDLHPTKPYARMVIYFVIPMLIIKFLFKEKPSDYGFQLGNWRKGLGWVVAVCVPLGIFLWLFARTPQMTQYYNARSYGNVAQILYFTAVDLFSWEFIWRGFMLFGMARYLGAGPAIFLQAVPFAYMHLGKPDLETFSTIFGGAGFGFIAWRTKSFVYPWFIHWFIASLTMLVASGFF